MNCAKSSLVAFLPELGRWDSKPLTSLVGLAPWSRDSGRKRDHRAIRGGRGIVRKALYLCACSVIQVEGELRHFYQNLRQARETRQRGFGGRDAQAAVAAKRSGPTGNAMGAVGSIAESHWQLAGRLDVRPQILFGLCWGEVRRPSLSNGLP